MHAARRTGRIGLPTGFAFALIVVLVMPHSMPRKGQYQRMRSPSGYRESQRRPLCARASP
jgi:hypothetical protein